MVFVDGIYFNPTCRKSAAVYFYLKYIKTNTSILFTHLKIVNVLRMDIASPLWRNHVLQRAQQLDDILLSYTNVS